MYSLYGNCEKLASLFFSESDTQFQDGISPLLSELTHQYVKNDEIKEFKNGIIFSGKL